MSKRGTISVVGLVIIIIACSLGQAVATSSIPPSTLPKDSSQAPPLDSAQDAPPQPDQPPSDTQSGEVAAAGAIFVAYVPSDSIGNIAVQISLPEQPRYEDGAGIVVNLSSFFTDSRDFQVDVAGTALGLIHVAYLWPGKSNPSGARSEGTFDYGGEDSIQALRDVIRFASGQIPDRDGRYLEDLIAIQPLTDQVGIFAFSHQGIAAVNVLALYGDQLPSVGYFVGRENPTLDTLSSVEIGYWGEDNHPVVNPNYNYPSSYTPTEIRSDYSSVRWDPTYIQSGWSYVGRAYLDLNSNGTLDGSDFIFGPKIPTMYGKRFYSLALTQALLDNGSLTSATWPEDLATPEEASEIWPFRTSTHRYPDLRSKTPDLKVMLVMARRDHVQPARDKPHIHHAYDGFHDAAGLWTRLNPDQAYIHWLDPEFGAVYPENQANVAPVDWLTVEDWCYPQFRGAAALASLASVAEMADRLHENEWGNDLDSVLVDTLASDPTK